MTAGAGLMRVGMTAATSGGAQRRTVRSAVVMFAALAIAGCGAGASNEVAPTVPLDVRLRLDEAAFAGPPVPQDMVPFDVVSADMDLDGDPDLLINWHNLAPLELFENRGGEFVALNAAGADVSGLFETEDIASLYATTEAMAAEMGDRGSGVFIWHDPAPRGDWNIYVVPQDGPVRLQLRANKPLTPRIDEAAFRRVSELEVEMEVAEPFHFHVGVEYVATQLAVRASLQIFVGSDLMPMGDAVDLWRDDPHGIAWVDVRSSPEPEIFVTRGGLQGTLVPPLDPKRDRFFEYMGGTPRYLDVRTLVPEGYGRGRRLEWVDVDGDGVNELYIGNTETPNTLFAIGGDGAYEDIAAASGLAIMQGDAFAWIDIDEDGLDDLVFVDAEGFGVAYNRGERHFETARGYEVGLVFPADASTDQGGLFGSLALQVLDIDNDGRLDLWLAGYGADRRHALYRSVPAGGFVDATVAVGLDAAPLSNGTVFLDLENDGFMDALTFGVGATWLKNRQGQFVVEAADPAWGLREFSRAAGIDVDGDERQDVAIVAHRRMVLRNETVGGGQALRVSLRGATGDPVGAVVTVFHTDGMTSSRRFGSSLGSRFSQGVLPLHFGVPRGNPIERVEVRWPGGDTESRTVSADQDLIEISR